MKELSSNLQLRMVELTELETKMDEFKAEISEQVSAILASRSTMQAVPIKEVPDLIDLGDVSSSQD